MAEVIVAFDVATDREALQIADRLPSLRWAKIGPMLFLRYGSAIIDEFKSRDIKIFLDLKWHDIPHAVAGAVRAAADLGVDLATVHALGGAEMLAAAVAASDSVRVAAVSVLTSHSAASYSEASGIERGELGGEVTRLAQLAMANGVTAIVTSPLEVESVRALVSPGTWLVAPGIRPPGADAGDQRRLADPAAAVRAGATHIVVGRPITRADSPELVYNQICEEIA